VNQAFVNIINLINNFKEFKMNKVELKLIGNTVMETIDGINTKRVYPNVLNAEMAFKKALDSYIKLIKEPKLTINEI
jgi:hypothetical protein